MAGPENSKKQGNEVGIQGDVNLDVIFDDSSSENDKSGSRNRNTPEAFSFLDDHQR